MLVYQSVWFVDSQLVARLRGGPPPHRETGPPGYLGTRLGRFAGASGHPGTFSCGFRMFTARWVVMCEENQKQHI